MLFVDVLLPLHLPGTYTYRLPVEYEESVRVGQRVMVQFGAKRLYSALVRRIHDQVPAYRTKYVLAILDLEPIVTERQFRFWEWMASYYMCFPGDVMAVALPASLRLSSQSFIVVHPDFSGDCSSLSPDEARILDVLSRRNRIALDEVEQITGYKKIMPLVKSMIEKRIVLLDEELQQRFSPRRSAWISLAPDYVDNEPLQHELFDTLEHKAAYHKQLLVLLRFMQLSSFGHQPVAKKVLTDDKALSSSALDTLVRKGILVLSQREESRLVDPSSSQTVSPLTIKLSGEQQQAYQLISDAQQPVSLLHGVTSSGKTEVYIRLIHDVLARGQQVLFLLPEIALTAQIINRLRRFFGSAVGVYHSRFNSRERAEVWQRTLQQGPNGYQLLLGARSAIFLPFHNLGLVIVDEEHDPSYKQADPAPRYNGRDAALYLARLHGARALLGSATPSVESYHHATSGKFALATMSHRYGGVLMPEVICVDMKDAQRKRQVRLNFSQTLIDAVREALSLQQQVILFQNRRGFSPRLECDICHHIPQCVNCDVSLVYHKASSSLRCHYCGYSIPVPSVCPACHSPQVKMRGFGTERIEDDLSILFPDARIARMDLDSTSRKNRYLEILNDFEDRRTDILVGTQMVTKGLDFDNVAVVGILSADNLISYPDFRSYERAFQQITQVSGRAGRHSARGTVIIQTYQPYHQAIRDAMDNDYLSMFKSQITERRVFNYPPFSRLVYILVRHAQSQIVDAAADDLASRLRTLFGNRVVGPEYPNVPRVRNIYIKKILVRFALGEAVAQGKQLILQTADLILQNKDYPRLNLLFDVDPM